MEEKIKKIFEQALRLKEKTNLVNSIRKAIEIIFNCYQTKNKILICGNGGSFTQAEHFAGEMVARFKIEGKPLPALALGSNSAALTAWSNDYNFETAFARELKALGREGDVLIVISTSGNSKNVIEAAKTAKELGIKTIGLLGGEGGNVEELVDLSLKVPCEETARIQEIHLIIIHILCGIVEEMIYGRPAQNN